MKRTLVVGGAGALGGAIVRQLLARGDEVVVAGRSRPAEPGVSRFHAVDASTADWPALYASIEEEIAAPLDAVIFVAGTAAYGKTPLVPEEVARAVFELNFWAVGRAAVAAAERWRGAGRSGTFAAVLSIVARRAVPFEAHYAASKAAAARFLECLDLEHAGRGIRFVSAFPGTLDTPFRARAPRFGLAPDRGGGGADVDRTARAILRLVEGKRWARVIGWRERIIDLADRFAPGLYDRAVLRRRVARKSG